MDHNFDNQPYACISAAYVSTEVKLYWSNAPNYEGVHRALIFEIAGLAWGSSYYYSSVYAMFW